MHALKRFNAAFQRAPRSKLENTSVVHKDRHGQRCHILRSSEINPDNGDSAHIVPAIVDRPVKPTIYSAARQPRPDVFVESFLQWCDNAGIHGQVDLTSLFIAAEEFAEYSDISMLSRMSLCKALARRGVKKKIKDLAKFETNFGKAQFDRSLRRDHVLRPRVTVYELPSHNNKEKDEASQQKDLFDEF